MKIIHDLLRGRKYHEFGDDPHCEKCGRQIRTKSDQLVDYFYNKTIYCESCTHNMSWWDYVLNEIKSKGFKHTILRSIGAVNTFLTINIKPNEIYRLNLDEYGVLADAIIFEINYTPTSEGNLFPLEMHSNTPIRHFIPHKIMLYPMSYPTKTPSQTSVQVSVIWAKKSSENIFMQSLMKSFESYILENFEEAIVSANVVIESLIIKVLATYITTSVSSSPYTNSTLKRTSYNDMLNIILPLIIKEKKLPAMTDNIFRALNTLRKARNEVAHKGFIGNDIKREQIAEFLCASVFGYHYLNHINGIINHQE